MSKDLSQFFEDQINSDQLEVFFAVEMLFETEPLRIWTGYGELQHDGDTYTGVGVLLGLSDMTETPDIEAVNVDLTLSGVPFEIVSLALQEPYQGRKCIIYFGVREGTDTALTEIFSGFMDQMEIDEGGDLSTITLKVENRLVDLERIRVRRYSSGYQKSVFPGDKGFEFVEDLQDRRIVWGRDSG